MRCENMRTIIIGAGGQAKIYTEILEMNGVNLIGYVSSEPRGTKINKYSVLCSIDELVNKENEIKAEAVIVSIGDNYWRKNIVEKIQCLNLKNINVIHPSAIISKDVCLGEGIYIGANAVINPGTIIRSYSTVGVKSSIGHDCVLNDYVNISPGATIAGSVLINEFAVVGLGASIIEKINIGSYSIVGAGGVAIKDTESFSIVMGVPAKVIKYRDLSNSYLK